MPSNPVIVWFRQDLRIADNPALLAAAETGAPVLPVYVLDNATSSDWSMGSASRWWLHHALASLADDLEGINSSLILRRGNSSDVLDQLIEETGAQTVFWNRCYEPDVIRRDKALKADLLDRDIEARSFNASLLFEPWTIETKTGGPYRVFSPFWRACMGKTAGLEHACAKPKSLEAPDAWPASDALPDWSLTPTSPDWAKGFSDMWQPGTKGALDRLSRFLDNTINDYPDARDCPGVDGTSGLSPHLHFGDIGPRQVYWAARDAADDGRATDKAVKKFVAELGWREFSYHLLYHFPAIPTDNFQNKFDDFPWRQDDDGLRAWQRGMTGYPMVDAGMRQLWQTGWMHNRVRMIVASFLVKHLMIHWHEGEKWFWDTLVDADLANNAASWQWVAGSGADAAPYFRIFNPITQGQKFDAKGDYIRRYVPELSKLPDKYIHSPWTAPEEVLDEAGVNLGTDYPDPVVDHSDARTRALDGYQEIRKAG